MLSPPERPTQGPLTPAVVGSLHAPWSSGRSPSHRCARGTPRVVRRAGAGVLARLEAATTSAVTVVAPWGQTPSRAWLGTVDGELAAVGGTPDLYDTSVPDHVLTVLAENRHLSAVLPLTGRDVIFDEAGSDPLFVDGSGRVRPGRLPEARWFARVGYPSNPEADVEVALVDGTRETVLRSPGARPPGLLGATLQASRPAAGDRVVTTGRDDEVNLCVGDLVVGLPGAAP